MRCRFTVVVYALVFVFMFFASAATAAPEITLRFAGQYPPDHPGTGYMNDIAKEVLERSGGRIELKVYPANILGDYGMVHQELIKGTMDLALISFPGDIDPRLNFVYINGYASDYEPLAKIFSKNGWAYKRMEELDGALKVKFLGFNVEGFIGIASVKPIHEPLKPGVDKGVLCRVPNMAVYQLPAQAMGFRTMTIPYSDLYTSLQTGVVDAIDGLPPAAAYTILKDVTKHYYCLNYSVECIGYQMSMKTYEKLKPEDRDLIAEVVGKAAEKSVTLAQSDDERYLKLMEDAGIKVYRYTDEELRPMMKAVSETWPALSGVMTKEFMDEFVKEFTPK
jgi:TRAP-type C4-dicarboxylate transport system substrate-binding protein